VGPKTTAHHVMHWAHGGQTELGKAVVWQYVLRIDQPDPESRDRLALIIGDMVHNLRSALRIPGISWRKEAATAERRIAELTPSHPQ
jgi:transketolase